MNALLNFYSPILQWVFPLVLINYYGLAFFGEFSLVLSLISPFIIILSLSSKNLFFSGFLKCNEPEFLFHLTFKNVISILLIALSIIFYSYGENIISIVFFIKAVDFVLDSMILNVNKSNRYSIFCIVIVSTSVLFFIASLIFKIPAVYISYLLLFFLVVWNLSKLFVLDFKLVYIKNSFYSSIYTASGAVAVYLQRLFVVGNTNAEFLGLFSLLMQFLVAWSLFLQSLFVQLGFKLYEVRRNCIVLLILSLIGFFFLEPLIAFLFKVNDINYYFTLFLMFLFCCVYAELFYFYKLHKVNIKKVWVPQLFSLLYIAVCAYFVKIDSHNLILLFIVGFYLIRVMIFYIVNKVELRVN